MKPGNIMVDEHGLVKVLDFGLAKLVETMPGENESTRTLNGQTEEGTIVGTVAYMSPEQAEKFEKIVSHKAAYWGPFYPLACLGQARAAATAGDSGRTRLAYQDFLALWKDADRDLPILKSAQQEYAALR